jgi:hypothetical protein
MRDWKWLQSPFVGIMLLMVTLLAVTMIQREQDARLTALEDAPPCGAAHEIATDDRNANADAAREAGVR